MSDLAKIAYATCPIIIEWEGPSSDSNGGGTLITEYIEWDRLDEFIAQEIKDSGYTYYATRCGEWESAAKAVESAVFARLIAAAEQSLVNDHDGLVEVLPDGSEKYVTVEEWLRAMQERGRD